MSWRKPQARRKKLAKLSRVFQFELRPQNSEHNGHWSVKRKSKKFLDSRGQ